MGVERPSDAAKVEVLEAIAAGKPLDGRQRTICHAMGLEWREVVQPVLERDWDSASRTLLWRLLRRGWTAPAIAVFCRRSVTSVRSELRRCGWDLYVPPVPLMVGRRRALQGALGVTG